MPGRARFVALGVVSLSSPAVGQLPLPPAGPIVVPGTTPPATGPNFPPQRSIGEPPLLPGQPGPLPASVRPGVGLGGDPTPADGGFPVPDPGVRTPQKEKFVTLDVTTLALRPLNGDWRLFAGQVMLHDFKSNQPDANVARRAVQDLRPTVWGTIGNPSAIGSDTVVGYGVSAGRPTNVVPAVPQSVAFDLKSLRVEQVQGVWCLRDGANLIVSFGKNRPDADQAVAVCKKYGFNRLGQIGTPPFSFLYAAPAAAAAGEDVTGAALLVRAAQEEALTRTGVPVPGGGYVGERLVLDPRNLEVRKDRADYVLAHGADVLAKFGANEWSARDALRVVKDGRFTEFCRVGGLTFFLENGQPPTRVPFFARGTRFAPGSLRVQALDGRWVVFDSGGHTVCTATSQQEAEQAIRVIQAYKFDQLCEVGQWPRPALRFLAKTGGH